MNHPPWRIADANRKMFVSIENDKPKWRNWQTRQLQELVPVREWRFESSLRHCCSVGVYVEVTQTPSFLADIFGVKMVSVHRSRWSHIDCPPFYHLKGGHHGVRRKAWRRIPACFPIQRKAIHEQPQDE